MGSRIIYFINMKNSAELFLTFFVLAMTYTCFLLYTVLRIYQFKSFTPEWKYAKLIYIFQFIDLLLRTTSFWLICFMQDSIKFSQDLVFSTLSLPDSLIVASFIVLFWIMITCTMHTRIDSDCVSCEGHHLLRAGKITLASLSVWLVLELFLFFLLFANLITREAIFLQICVWNFLSSGIVLIGLIVVQVKYSGLPFKSDQARKFMKTVNFVTVVWIICRTSHGVLYFIRENIIDEKNYSNMNDLFENLETVILLIVDFLMTELMCYFLILDFSFFRIFKNDFIDAPMISHLILADGLSMHERIEPEISVLSTTEVNQMSNIALLHDGKCKLGTIYTAEANSVKFALRRINLTRVNKYVIENLQSDLEEIQNLKINRLVKCKGFTLKKNELDINMPYFAKGSLYDNIHEKKVKFSLVHKVKMALEISETMLGIHSAHKVHGHLTSFNILLDDENKPFISDLGFDHLKKFCGISLMYSNKSAWSSPEILNDPSNVVTRCTASDDVYSFGIVLWEIMFESVPFPGYSLAKLREMVGKEGYRPAILECNIAGISELLKSCWNVEPVKRPDFFLINTELTRIAGIFEGNYY